MTLSAACALAPALQHASYRAEEEGAALHALAEAHLPLTPAFELSAPEGFWMDASAAHLAGGEEAFARAVLHLARAHGFRGRCVIASQRFTAHALARQGREVRVIPEAGGGEALAPLPLSALRDEAPRAHAALAALGLKTLGEVAALSSTAFVSRAGTEGLRAHLLACGRDERLFVPAVLPETLEEHLALDWAAESLEPLLFGLKTLVDRLCARLGGRGRAAVRLSVTLQMEREEKRVPLTLARPTASARLLVELARHTLESVQLPGPVVGLHVRVEEACESQGAQLSLGETPTGDVSLEGVLSRLASALGATALSSPVLRPQHRPEAAQATRAFRPPRRATGLLAETTAPSTAPRPENRAGVSERPTRLLPKALALEVREGPSGALSAVHLMGHWRSVAALSGPERLKGEWWQEPFFRDYYRVHAEGVGPVWVYREGRTGRFFLQGLFD